MYFFLFHQFLLLNYKIIKKKISINNICSKSLMNQIQVICWLKNSLRFGNPVISLHQNSVFPVRRLFQYFVKLSLSVNWFEYNDWIFRSFELKITLRFPSIEMIVPPWIHGIAVNFVFTFVTITIIVATFVTVQTIIIRLIAFETWTFRFHFTYFLRIPFFPCKYKINLYIFLKILIENFVLNYFKHWK